jgi:hypothetical protein
MNKIKKDRLGIEILGYQSGECALASYNHTRGLALILILSIL